MSVGVCQNTFDQTKSPRVAHRLQPQGQGQARVHKQRTWTKGQWVYVWRKFPGTGNGHLTRARWVGPGLVITQDSHSVWISMRSRIWKCCSDQLRPANHIEPLGAELIGSKDLAGSLVSEESLPPRSLTPIPEENVAPAPLLIRWLQKIEKAPSRQRRLRQEAGGPSVESEVLERAALRELKRLEREDRLRLQGERAMAVLPPDPWIAPELQQRRLKNLSLMVQMVSQRKFQKQMRMNTFFTLMPSTSSP